MASLNDGRSRLSDEGDTKAETISQMLAACAGEEPTAGHLQMQPKVAAMLGVDPSALDGDPDDIVPPDSAWQPEER